MSGYAIPESELLKILEEEIEEYGLRGFCRRHDLDPGNVSNVRNGKLHMQRSIAQALGYEPAMMWKPIR